MIQYVAETVECRSVSCYGWGQLIQVDVDEKKKVGVSMCFLATVVSRNSSPAELETKLPFWSLVIWSKSH